MIKNKSDKKVMVKFASDKEMAYVVDTLHVVNQFRKARNLPLLTLPQFTGNCVLTAVEKIREAISETNNKQETKDDTGTDDTGTVAGPSQRTDEQDVRDNEKEE